MVKYDIKSFSVQILEDMNEAMTEDNAMSRKLV